MKKFFNIKYVIASGTKWSVAIAKSSNFNKITTSCLRTPRNDRKAFTLAEVLITLGIIGVVAAATLSILIKNYQKHVTVSRLKKAYSEFYQVLNRSIADNDNIDNWDFNINAQVFFETYLEPYMKVTKVNNSGGKSKWESYTNKYMFQNGTIFSGTIYHNTDVQPYFNITIDINGDKLPNKFGRDKFSFFITYKKSDVAFNTGIGNFGSPSKISTKGGLYPDGIGYKRSTLLNDNYRGCNKTGFFCSELIIFDGWKISDDYPW